MLFTAVRILSLAVVVTLMGCHSRRAAFSSDIKMSDRSATRQLLAGFHDLEQNKWRWTSRRFAVVLQSPKGAERYGATLRAQFYIPTASIRKLGPITLSSEADELPLAPETFVKDGVYEYSRKIPPAVFHDVLLPVVFTLDKALVPEDVQAQELAVVMAEVSIELNK